MGAKTGGELIIDINQRRVPERALGLWWLGQASFAVRGGETVAYIDPFLSARSSRMVPPPLSPDQVDNAGLVLCTHDHDDHLDPDTLAGIAAASPGAVFVVPEACRSAVIAAGVHGDRVVAARVDQPVEFGEIVVTAIPAAHEELDFSPEPGYPYLGYVLQVNGVTLYHSGDCTIYQGLAERLAQHKPDLALLPINGHDWKRLHEGIIGNMSFREAADLAAEVGVDTVIPIHYGMFKNNTEPPGYFVNYIHEYYPTQKIHVMARYEGFVYLKGY